MPTTPVLDSTIVHRELGSGAPIVFLHGNKTGGEKRRPAEQIRRTAPGRRRPRRTPRARD